MDHVICLCFFNVKIKKIPLKSLKTNIFSKFKPGFTDFRYFTPSLRRLQKFFSQSTLIGKKMLCIKLPNSHEIFKKNKIVIQKMQQIYQKQKITLYNYIYLELIQNFQPEKLRTCTILLCDITDYVIYTYFSVYKYKNYCFQKKGHIKPTFLQLILIITF